MKGCIEQPYFLRNEEKYLANHVIETKQADGELECGILCVAVQSCASVNYKTSGIGKGRCELNNKTLQKAPVEGTDNSEFTHLAVIKRVSKLSYAMDIIRTGAFIVNSSL